jgi:hypothetical protein
MEYSAGVPLADENAVDQFDGAVFAPDLLQRSGTANDFNNVTVRGSAGHSLG